MINNYKKVQMILLISIIIATIVFAITIIKTKQKKEIAEPTLAEAVTGTIE